MPHYQVEYKIHLPKDPPWRDTNANVRRVARAQSPQALFSTAILDLAKAMGFGSTTHMLAGLFLDLINPLPDEIREGIAAGIVRGWGLTLTAEKGEITATLDQKYDTLDQGEGKRTKSGLLIPSEGVKQ